MKVSLNITFFCKVLLSSNFNQFIFIFHCKCLKLLWIFFYPLDPRSCWLGDTKLDALHITDHIFQKFITIMYNLNPTVEVFREIVGLLILIGSVTIHIYFKDSPSEALLLTDISQQEVSNRDISGLVLYI